MRLTSESQTVLIPACYNTPEMAHSNCDACIQFVSCYICMYSCIYIYIYIIYTQFVSCCSQSFFQCVSMVIISGLHFLSHFDKSYINLKVFQCRL